MSLDTFFSTLQLGLVYSVLALGLCLSVISPSPVTK